MTREPIQSQPPSEPDPRDRLIMALYAELKAERSTREALEEAIRSGVVSRDVLSAIVSDPVPVVTSDDIAEIETALASDEQAGRRRVR
ncbi:hypothetical protein SAMN05421890_1220 [Ensifer adhaerens]|nr:hypothetical protein SAMN05421890_1220 [Ensifer adhaerens]